MANFFAELTRRHIYRVAAAYAVVAWIVLQIVNNIAPGLNLPNAVLTAVIVLLAAGFPIALIFAWVAEQKTAEAPDRTKNGAADWVLAGAAVAVVATIAYQQFVPAPSTKTQQTGVVAARVASAKPAGVSIAVLPFANMSGDAGQEFFSDGMTEEITTALAKVPDLRVVGRTSAFQFKGANKDLRAIGQALSATHLIEGSVRKAGNRVRITAQLIKADDGTHIWAEDYDRDLTDIFAIQEDIARTITSSLHMTLGLKPGENLVNQRTRSAALHDEYLRAKNLVRMDQINDAIKILGDFVAREPAYAPAWAELAVAYNEKLLDNRDLAFGNAVAVQTVVREGIAKRNAAAEQALKLDPDNAQANCAASTGRMERGDVIAGMELKERGMALGLDEPDCLEGYGNWLNNLGFTDKGLEALKHLSVVEPLLPASRSNLGKALFYAGQTEAAQNLLEQYFPKGNGFLALIYAAQGQVQRGADAVAALQRPDEAPVMAKAAAAAIRLLRAAPAPSPPDSPELGYFDWVYVYTGAPERFMGMYEDHLRVGFTSGPQNGAEWIPAYASVRKTERFKKWIRDSGIYAYWRAKGWPPQCHPTTGDDFACE